MSQQNDRGKGFTRRQFVTATGAALGLMATGGLLASCGKKAGGRGGKTKIVFTTQGAENHQKMYGEMIQAFNEKFPNIEVEPIYVPGGAVEMQQKLLTMISGGTPPDVTWTHTYINNALAQRGVLLDLKPFLKGDLTEGDFFTASIKDFDWQGKLYALPRETTAGVFIYNRTLFQEANVAPPEDGWQWDDMVRAGERLSKGSGQDRIFGVANWHQGYASMIKTWLEGGDVLSPDRSKFTWNDAAGVRALKAIQDMIHESKIHPTMDDLTGQVDLMAQGKIAMQVTYSVFSNMTDVKFDWDIAHVPQKTPRTTRVASAGHAILKSTKNAEAAYEWLKFMHSGPGMAIFARNGYSIAYRPVAEPLYTNNEGLPKNKKIVIEALEYARPEPVAGNWVAAHREFTKALGAIYGITKDDPKTAMDEIEAAVNAAIKEK